MSTEVKPQKPWAKRPADRVRELSIVLAAVAFSLAFVAATELKGKLAYALIFFIAYGLLSSTFAFIKRGAPAAKDAFVSTLVSLGAVLTVLPMMSILFTVISKGLPGLHFGLLTSDMWYFDRTLPNGSKRKILWTYSLFSSSDVWCSIDCGGTLYPVCSFIHNH